jgi:hypothetical protein
MENMTTMLSQDSKMPEMVLSIMAGPTLSLGLIMEMMMMESLFLLRLMVA